MRHNVKGRKLGRTASHRKALINNLLQSLITHKSIKTTVEKAKETQKVFDKLVTFGKKNDVAARREAYKYLKDRTLVQVLFEDIAPELADRNGGYTRIDKLYYRRGDGALISQLQILGFEKFIREDEEMEEEVPEVQEAEEVTEDKETEKSES